MANHPDSWWIHGALPSGKHTKNYGKSSFYSWVNQLFLWPFSIAFWFFVCLPEANHGSFQNQAAQCPSYWPAPAAPRAPHPSAPPLRRRTALGFPGWRRHGRPDRSTEIATYTKWCVKIIYCVYICIYIYTYTHSCMVIRVYIYIHMHNVSNKLFNDVHIYIYMYIPRPQVTLVLGSWPIEWRVDQPKEGSFECQVCKIMNGLCIIVYSIHIYIYMCIIDYQCCSLRVQYNKCIQVHYIYIYTCIIVLE